MMMIKRILLVFLGIIVIGGVVVLGLWATTNQSAVLWFGIAAAVLAPFGVELIISGFRISEGAVLEKLSKISELDTLLAQAKTVEEKKRLLEQEKENLTKIVEYESRKQFLFARKTSLEFEADKIINELGAIDTELQKAEVNYCPSLARTEIEYLQKRILAKAQGGVVLRIGKHDLVISKEVFGVLPSGSLLYLLFRNSEKFSVAVLSYINDLASKNKRAKG